MIHSVKMIHSTCIMGLYILCVKNVLIYDYVGKCGLTAFQT